MSNPERGAYTPPTEQPLSFDARQPVRGRGPAPLMLILSALVLVGIVGAIAMVYRSGVHQGKEAPQAVGTPVGSIKGPASAAAQPAEPAAGLQIYHAAQDQTGAIAATTFAPPPEQPMLRAKPPVPAATALASVVVPPPGPVVALPINPPPPAVLKPAIAAAAPIPKPQPAPPAKPVVAVKAPPVVVKAVEAPKAVATKIGAASVQIGAFSSSALADKGWNDAARAVPGLAAGKGKKVEEIQKDGATLFRTTVTGFGSRADAAAFCDQLKAGGKSCFVK